MEFLGQHYTISFAMLIVWILTYWYGKKIDDKNKIQFGYFLIGIALFKNLQIILEDIMVALMGYMIFNY